MGDLCILRRPEQWVGGEIPTDSGYDTARTVWNAIIDRRPALISGCRSTSDVVAVVEGGALWGDVDRETQAFGLPTPANTFRFELNIAQER